MIDLGYLEDYAFNFFLTFPSSDTWNEYFLKSAKPHINSGCRY